MRADTSRLQQVCLQTVQICHGASQGKVVIGNIDEPSCIPYSPISLYLI